MPEGSRVLSRIQDQDDFSSELTWVARHTFHESIIVGSGVGSGFVDTKPPSNGSGNNLELRSTNAISGNTNGGDILLLPGSKSGSGADGRVIFQAATASPGKVWQILSNTGTVVAEFDFANAGLFLAHTWSVGAMGVLYLRAGIGGSIISRSIHLEIRDVSNNNTGVVLYPSTSPQCVNVTPSASSIGIVVRGASSQTANLQEWRNSSGTVLARVNNNGVLKFPNGVTSFNNLHISGPSDIIGMAFDANSGLNFGNTGVGSVICLNYHIGVTLRNGWYLGWSANPFNQTTTPEVHMTRGTARTIHTEGNHRISPTNAADRPLVVHGTTSQTGNLQEWASVTGEVYCTVSENGCLTTRKTSEPADSELQAGELTFWFDSTVDGSKVMFKGKNAAGTVVRAELPMS